MDRRTFALSPFALAAGGITGAIAPAAMAQSFPARPIRAVVPFPAGSAGDIAMRLVAKDISEGLKQPVTIDNRAGAQGVIGTVEVARAPPDGYTILLAAISFAAAPAEFKVINYDPVKDFVPVGFIGHLPLALMVRPDFPAKTPQEFLAYLRSRSKPLAAGYGSSSSRVCIAQLGTLAKVAILEVPYKGIPLAFADLIGGQIDFTFVDLGNAVTQHRGGKLRAIALTSARRSPIVPDWPTLAETVPGFDIAAWLSIVAPAGTPADVAQRLNDEINKALAKPEVQRGLHQAGVGELAMTRPVLGEFIKTETDRWARMSAAAGIVPQ